jgi:hypothetical protein
MNITINLRTKEIEVIDKTNLGELIEKLAEFGINFHDFTLICKPIPQWNIPTVWTDNTANPFQYITTTNCGVCTGNGGTCTGKCIQY